MAYTQIHAIKATVEKAVAYIINGAKTDEKTLITSYATGPETAKFDFASTLSNTLQHDQILAYHLIQSFLPGEVGFEEAHQIGKEFADRFLQGKYAYVLTTHIDKNHVHNHLIFCAADFVDFKKFHSCKTNNYLIRSISDDLCLKHGLSIIIPGEKRGQKYIEWHANKKGSSIRETLKKDIDSCIQAASSYPMFLSLMQAHGYEIKGETFGEGSLKYISFKPAGSDIFFRGCSRTLGNGYTKHEIATRIIENVRKKEKAKAPTLQTIPKKTIILGDTAIKTITLEELLKKKAKTLTPASSDRLIDTTTDKMLSSPALLNWAKKMNLQTLSHFYATTENLSALQSEIAEKKETLSALQDSLSTLNEKLIPAGEIAHTASVCKDNMRYETAMQKSKDPDRYYRMHAEKLSLFRAAKHILESKYGLKVETLDFDQVAAKYALMQGKKGSLQDSIKELQEEIKDLEYVHETLKDYLYPSTEEHPEKDPEKKPHRNPERPK